MPRSATASTSPDDPPPQATQTATRRPRIVVAGSNELRVVRVARRLERLRARVDQLSFSQAIDALAGDVAALVLVDPLRDLRMAAAVKEVRGHPGGGDLPAYVVVDDYTSSKRILKLFSAGASAVFEWPREAAVMSALFAESFGIARVRGRSTKPDQALGRTIRAHLRLYPELGVRSVVCKIAVS